MNKTLPLKLPAAHKRIVQLSILAILIIVALTLLQDLVRASLHRSAFYFSESLLFSSFWWLFVPLLLAQHAIIQRYPVKGNWLLYCMAMVLPVLLHLVLFPLLVWILSGLFYYHTYALQQTLRYVLAEYVYLLILLYTIPLAIYSQVVRSKKKNDLPAALTTTPTTPLVTTIFVRDGHKKLALPVSAILYCAANPPYITIHTAQKKYLHNDTLKAITTQLPPDQFVRIHRSSIINIKMVATYQSRQNGDYDVVMTNAKELRVSRMYAANFKSKLQLAHQLTTK